MPNRIEEFEFQSRPKKPVLYNFGPEARDACMAALTLSLENFAKWQNGKLLLLFIIYTDTIIWIEKCAYIGKSETFMSERLHLCLFAILIFTVFWRRSWVHFGVSYVWKLMYLTLITRVRRRRDVFLSWSKIFETIPATEIRGWVH